MAVSEMNDMGHDVLGLKSLSHMRFQSKFQSSRLPLHLTHGRLTNTIGGIVANWAFTQNQLNKMELPTKSQS